MAGLPQFRIEMLIGRIWNNKLNKYTFLEEMLYYKNSQY